MEVIVVALKATAAWPAQRPNVPSDKHRDLPPAKAPFRRDRRSAGGPLREIRPIGALGSAVIRPAMARHPETGGMRTKSAAGRGRRQAKS